MGATKKLYSELSEQNAIRASKQDKEAYMACLWPYVKKPKYKKKP